ncbi:MAG: efflux RND transporter periplasmic adaptor subunit [Acidobacteria bacterium]|nr:efflux RND transporter periplasmic adaptor subunit [Acidobacteriota bacterium]
MSGLLAVVFLGIWLPSRPQPATPTEPAIASVTDHVIELSPEAQSNAKLKIVEVQELPLERTLPATGVIAADPNRLAHLRPLARGVAEQVLVQLGDRVEKGASLLNYDNIELGELIGNYLTLQAEIEQEEARVEVAQQYLERAEALLQAEAIARKDYELRAAEYKQALAMTASKRAALTQVEEKIHRLGLTDADLQKLGESEPGTHRTSSHNILRTPFAGVITKFDVAPGEILEPEREIFTVADTSVVWALADIYEKDLGQIEVGQSCRVRVPAYPDRIFTGEITYLSDVLHPDSRTSKLRCVVDNRDGRLKLGMFATLEIPLPLQRHAIMLPDSAAQVVDGRSVVFVVKDDTHFEKRNVELGERFGDWLEVRAGVHPSEKVVSEGTFYLKSAFLRGQISGEE